jgi:hypothetical protein
MVPRYYLGAAAAAVKLPVDPGPGAPGHHEFRWLKVDAARAVRPATQRLRHARQCI